MNGQMITGVHGGHWGGTLGWSTLQRWGSMKGGLHGGGGGGTMLKIVYLLLIEHKEYNIDAM